jgi:septal ring factor EnvC (AmiA/AmiB activator)
MVLGAAAALLGAASMSLAQTNDENLSQQRLDRLGQEIKQHETTADDLEARVAKAHKDYAALQHQSVILASKIKTLESEIGITQARLAELRAEEEVVTRELRLQSADMAEALAAMQRLSVTPSSTLMAKPENIDTMARTALLFDAILPALDAQAEKLRHKIAEVESVQTAIQADQAELLGRQSALDEQRQALATVMAQKKARQKRMAGALGAERKRIAQLTREAKTLEDLIARLGTPKETGAVKDDFANVGKPVESLPFKGAKGRLSLPAPGMVISRFDQRQSDGQRSRGIRMETGAQAQIVSMWDGNIAFAGPFRDYGQLLIISHGGGYHTLLAGMARIDVNITQWVLAGEPVGLMQGAPLKEAKSEEKAGIFKPSLYIELRRDGRSIDPLPWIAVRQRKVKG